MEAEWKKLFFDLCRLRNQSDLRKTVDGIHDYRQNVRFSFGFNEGRNRSEQLMLFTKNALKQIDPRLTRFSLINIVPNKVPLYKSFLELRCRKHRNQKLMLDLRGTAMEKKFNRRFNDADLDFLLEFIEKTPKICGLHLAYNNLTNHGFEKLSHFLANQSTILYVNVMNNDITHLDEKQLVRKVSKWKVQCLNLRGNKIGQKGGETMANLLTKNTTIRHLALGETEQTVNSIISIVDTLIMFGGNETLTKLDLTRTLATINADEICRHLACVLEVNQSLVELVLSKNSISDHGLETLLKGIKHRNVLSRLNLSCNRISSLGAELIANILPMSQLEMLVLASNIIGDTGAIAIGSVFAFSKLKYLDISKNAIGDKGMSLLIWGINRPIDGLLIYGNKFTEYTLKVIYSHGSQSLIDCKCLDIQLRLEDDDRIKYSRRNRWEYSDWYYYVPEWKHKSVIQHCCCPIRGGILTELKS